MNENNQQTPAVTGEKKGNKTIIIIAAVIVVLALLGYGAKYLLGMFAITAMNAQLASEGVKVSGNPLTGGSYTITGDDGKKISVDTTGESYTVTDNMGNTYNVGEGAKIPDGFPSAVPLYAGAKVTSSAESLESGKKVYMVTLTTSDAFASVAGFYKEALKKSGWNITQEMNLSAGYSMYTAEAAGLEATAAIQGEAGAETSIMLAVRSKE